MMYALIENITMNKKKNINKHRKSKPETSGAGAGTPMQVV